MSSKSANAPLWKCPYPDCDYRAPSRRFQNKQKLNHIRVHTGERPYKCKQCVNNYRTAGQLSAHVKTTHTGPGKLQCVMCKKTFFYEGHLRRHAQAHTMEKPFFCHFENCGQEFRQRAGLLFHNLTHQAKKFTYRTLGNKSYKCLICGGFFSQYRLATHQCPRQTPKMSIIPSQENSEKPLYLITEAVAPSVQFCVADEPPRPATKFDILALACVYQIERENLKESDIEDAIF